MADAIERCCNSIRRVCNKEQAVKLANDLFEYETDAFYDLLNAMREISDRWDCANAYVDKKRQSRKP